MNKSFLTQQRCLTQTQTSWINESQMKPIKLLERAQASIKHQMRTRSIQGTKAFKGITQSLIKIKPNFQSWKTGPNANNKQTIKVFQDIKVTNPRSFMH